MSEPEKRFVCVVRAEADGRSYVGVTWNVAQPVATHNSGESLYTAAHRPWRLVVALEFAAEERALEFERYLKSGSDRAFAQRHFR